jgi:hypothetical protein
MLVAVDLDDEPRVPPHEIALDSLNAGVDLRPPQAVVVAQTQERLLHLAPGHDTSDHVMG